MKSKIIPSGSEVMREAVIVVAGAFLAAVVIGLMPDSWKQWMKDQWGGVPKP